jgi:nucleoside-diphosphate-sugar epimerase
MSQSSKATLPYSAIDTPVAGRDDVVLVTGANGFIGTRLVENLLARGYRRVRCFVRPTSRRTALEQVCSRLHNGQVEIMQGNLLNVEDCRAASRDAAVVLHLAAGRGEKSVPDAFLNSVVTTRNLLEALRHSQTLRRFVNVSSFAVYANTRKSSWRTLDESCPVESHPESSGDAYCFAKVKQDQIVAAYGQDFGVPYIMVRPGYVFGPGKAAISGRVGIGTFGIFLHLGGSNRIPFTYVDNCADAIVVAGLSEGINGQIFNIVDDNLPSSRQFLRAYKRRVRRFSTIYVPHVVSYALCWLWESYSRWSHEQLPPTFNRKKWHTYWKKTDYTNTKLKALGWTPIVSMAEGLGRYFDSCREGTVHA